MVTDITELKVLRKQTAEFIKHNPVEITLVRGGARTSDGAGGWTDAPGGPIQPQTMRMIIQGGNVASRNIDGEEVQPAFVLIGLHDADIKTGDTFVFNDMNHDVIYVREDHDYETWAEVIYRG